MSPGCSDRRHRLVRGSAFSGDAFGGAGGMFGWPSFTRFSRSLAYSSVCGFFVTARWSLGVGAFVVSVSLFTILFLSVVAGLREMPGVARRQEFATLECIVAESKLGSFLVVASRRSRRMMPPPFKPGYPFGSSVSVRRIDRWLHAR